MSDRTQLSAYSDLDALSDHLVERRICEKRIGQTTFEIDVIRVFTARGSDLEEARQRAYLAVDEIDFEGMQFRRDIGVTRG